MKSARIGRILGDYELLEGAGAGGFSVVWKAKHVETGALVALKIPRVPAFTEHLRQEAGLLLEAADEQVVPLLAVDLDHDPPYLVMPWLDGCNLPLPEDVPEPKQILPGLVRMLELAEIVARLHQRQIVHGDLKPGNVRLDEQQKIWLLDLGLARIQVQTKQQRSLALSLVSVDGHSISGTLDFMAPELLGGGEPTTASDIYSLGVILHKLLAGRPPAFGISPMTLNPYLPPGMGAFLERMLHRSATERFAEAGELVEPLTDFVWQERICSKRKDGHEKRRRAMAGRAQLRRGAGLLLQLSLPLMLISVGARYLWPLMASGEVKPWWLLGVPLGLMLVFHGAQRINLWIVGRIEQQRQRRLDARRRKRWTGAHG